MTGAVTEGGVDASAVLIPCEVVGERYRRRGGGGGASGLMVLVDVGTMFFLQIHVHRVRQEDVGDVVVLVAEHEVMMGGGGGTSPGAGALLSAGPLPVPETGAGAEGGRGHRSL